MQLCQNRLHLLVKSLFQWKEEQHEHHWEQNKSVKENVSGGYVAY